MIRDLLQHHVSAAVERLVTSGGLPSSLHVPVEIVDPKDPSHGDYATSWALAAAKPAGKNPRELAEMLKEALSGMVSPLAGEAGEPANREKKQSDHPSPQFPSVTGPLPQGERGFQRRLFASIDVAGPGFLNFRVTDEAWLEAVAWANEAGKDLAHPGRLDKARSESSRPQAGSELVSHRPSPLRLNVEFVSVNPNGPITVGSGRGAAFGSTLCNVLEAAGHQVHREYYINDGTNSEQMRAFAESVRAICLGQPVPDNGYKGDYVSAVAQHLLARHTKESVMEEANRSGRLAWFQRESEVAMLEAQKYDLGAFGLTYDTWFSEQSLHDSGKVAEAIQHLIANGSADEQPLRRKLKLAKGGVIEDVEFEVQPVEEDEEGPIVQAGEVGSGQSSNVNRPSSIGPTLWLRSTKFGDDMDRVLRRKDGRLTYIASDVAYHQDKFRRGSKLDKDGKTERADKLITILGPDHHGYIGRLHAVLAATEVGAGANSTDRSNSSEPLNAIDAKLFSSPEERDACRAALAKAQSELEVLIFQIVRFVKEGKPAPMRKRDGNIYSLRDLMTEIGKDAAPDKSPEEQIVVGKDVARFFYLMRSHDTHMDFDIDLATKGTEENPVFYVQYAHARICSILEKARAEGNSEEPKAKNVGHATADDRQNDADNSSLIVNRPSPSADSTIALHPKEAALIKKILDLPEEVARCAQDYGIHRLATYAIELARTFHHFYDACRVIQPENPALQAQRLALCQATRHALRGTLDLLGVSAPEKM